MLKLLMLRKKLETAREELRKHLESGEELRNRRDAFELRQKEIEESIAEINADSTQEERDAVDQAISEQEESGKTLTADEETFETKKGDLEKNVSDIEKEITEIEERTDNAGRSTPETNNNEERKVENFMKNRTKFFGMNMEQRSAFIAREDVKNFLTDVRSRFGAAHSETRGVNGGEVTVPTIILDVIRENIYDYSKLIKYVRLRKVKGKARQPILGEVPEAVWTEATKYLNELDMSLNAIEADAFKLGGYISIPNSVLEDGEDINLAAEIMEAMGEAIGKAIDRAIPYGTGVKMPLGFITRLAQKSKPANYPDFAPEWKDLSKSNIIELDATNKTGVEFFAALIEILGRAKPKGAIGAPVWLMTRQTHLTIMAKALAFNAAAALTAGINNTMPIVGGDIIELDESIMPENQIAGGYGEKYLLAERGGASLTTSEHAKFVEDQTVIKSTQRYDGMPIFAESFILVSIDGLSPVTSVDFAEDYANTDLGILSVSAELGAEGTVAVTIEGNTEDSLAYKVAAQPVSVKKGAKATGFTTWDGVSEIEAATGSYITVVELDDKKKIVSSGSAVVTAE